MNFWLVYSLEAASILYRRKPLLQQTRPWRGRRLSVTAVTMDRQRDLGDDELRVRCELAIVCLVAFALGATCSVAADQSDRKLPSWIWHTKQRTSGQQTQFTKFFSIPQSVTSAVLRCAGESAGVAVSLDENKIAQIEAIRSDRPD